MQSQQTFSPGTMVTSGQFEFACTLHTLNMEPLHSMWTSSTCGPGLNATCEHGIDVTLASANEPRHVYALWFLKHMCMHCLTLGKD